MSAYSRKIVGASRMVVFGLVTGALALGASAASAKGGVLNIEKVEFTRNADVRPAIKAECQLPEKLATYIEKYSEGNFDEIRKAGKGGTGVKSLKVYITDVAGAAGGSMTGAKGVTIQGKLTQGKKVLGTFEGRRRSGGGVVFGFKGTCSIMGRSAKALGKDVSKWLEAPTMKARIGELK